MATPTIAANFPTASELTLDRIKKLYSKDAAMRNSVEKYLSEFRQEIQFYIRDLLYDTTGVYDHTYGMRYDNNTWKIGDSIVEISDNDLVIDNIKYKGTPGLFELIFYKVPDLSKVQESDYAKYKSILLATNGHKQKYLSRGRINANRSFKYTNVISKIFPSEHKIHEKEQMTKTSTPVLKKTKPPIRRRLASEHPEGSGLKKNIFQFYKSRSLSPDSQLSDASEVEWKYHVDNRKKYKYLYWNEANELVDRLRDLIGEKSSGNDSKEILDEILSIIQELREENIVL